MALALLVLVAHLVTNLASPYELHRDEFLYLAMGEHLRLFTMDFPPFIALVARAERALLGDGMWAIRFVPMVCHAALVLLAAATARALGGRRVAQGIAALAVATSPIFLRPGNLFQPVILDQLWWTLALYALLRLSAAPADDPAPRGWLALGLAMGLGLLTKFSIVFIGAGTAVALLVTPLRRRLLTPWPWMALLIALVIGLPSLVGQIRLGWPVMGQVADLQSTQLERVTPLTFVGEQLLFGPLVLVALVGVWWGWRQAEQRARPVVVACVGAFALLLLLHGKSYYAGPIYPALAAVGATALEGWTTRLGRALRSAAEVALVVYGLMLLPLGLPIVPPGPMVRYATTLGLTGATTTNRGTVLELPQDYADMLGWKAIVGQAAQVWHGLTPDDRARAVLLAGNYGEAGALDFYGPALGLPKALCACGSYWFFGPGSKAGEVAVTVGVAGADLKPFFREARLVARLINSHAVPEEQVVSIAVARRPYRSLQAVWPGLSGHN